MMCHSPVRVSLFFLALGTAELMGAQDTTRAGRDTTAGRNTLVRKLPTVEVTSSVVPVASPSVRSGVPARVSVVGGQDIESWGQRLLPDVIAAQPGITLYDDLGSRYKPTLVARGFTASPVVGLPQGVSVFVDGIPANEPDAGQVNFDLLPLAHVQAVEVLSGTASLLGPHSLGGALNLLTRYGTGRPSSALEMSIGSHDFWSAEGSSEGVARGWSYYAGGGYEHERGWRQLTAARLGNAFAKVGRFGEHSGVSVQAFGATSYAETAGSLPLSVYAVRPDSNLTAGDFEDLDQLHLAATAYARTGPGRGSFNLYYRRHNAERFNVNQAEDPDVRAFSRNRTFGVTVDWRAAKDVSRGTFGLRLGAGGSANRVAVRIFAERVNPGLTTHVESPIGKLDAYSLADYRLGRLTVSAGLRYDVVRVPFRNRLEAARDTTSVFRRMSPRAGASLEVVRGVSTYISAGQSFRAPALIELACADPNEPCPLPFALGDDPPLRPVVATTYEVGWQVLRGPIVINASAYRTAVRDDIFVFPYNDATAPQGSTIDGYFGNIERTRREGLEAGSYLLLRGGHSVSATYALTRATFQTSAVEVFSIREAAGGDNVIERGDRLPLVPDQTLALSGSFHLPKGIDLGMSARYTGRRFLRGDEANEEPPLAGYWVGDTRFGHTLGAWEISAVVRNIVGRRHAAFGTFNINQSAGGVLERFVTPGEPRTLRVIVRRRFGPSDAAERADR
jgi:iron complex outermembrane receptor protein